MAAKDFDSVADHTDRSERMDDIVIESKHGIQPTQPQMSPGLVVSGVCDIPGTHRENDGDRLGRQDRAVIAKCSGIP
jgi:hypothetical protein